MLKEEFLAFLRSDKCLGIFRLCPQCVLFLRYVHFTEGHVESVGILQRRGKKGVDYTLQFLLYQSVIWSPGFVAKILLVSLTCVTILKILLVEFIGKGCYSVSNWIWWQRKIIKARIVTIECLLCARHSNRNCTQSLSFYLDVDPLSEN